MSCADRPPVPRPPVSALWARRVRLSRLPGVLSLWLVMILAGGCDEDRQAMGRLEKVWGKVGISPGRFETPRAMTLGPEDEVYVVDKTGRIQVFDREGNYLRGWSTPQQRNGRPTGISIDRRGRVLVADTHYHRILIYSPHGDLLASIDKTRGNQLGQFDLVADVVEDSAGNYFVSEYGENHRIQKFSPDWRPLVQWGGAGTEPGRFSRPQCLALDEEENLWVADSGNHRIQVFDREGRLLKLWGREGRGPGELCYPYGLALGPQQTIYVAESGNNRVQKLTRDGESLGWWGSGGREPGELSSPWAVALDSRGRLHVLDTYNHRVQTVKM